MRPSLASVRRGPRATRSASWARGSAVTLVSVATLLAAGCREGKPAFYTGFVGSDDAGVNGGPLNATGSLLPEAGLPPPGCDAGFQGNVCGCLDLPLLADPPNMYFVLDRSGSMNDDDKWATIRTVIAEVIERIGPRAKFGAAVFPGSQGPDECAAGQAVMPLLQGDAPSGTIGPTAQNFIAATSGGAGGGTPTAATLNALAPTLASFSGTTFAILATDGGPNCNAKATCDISACIANIESDPSCQPDAGPNCCLDDPQNCLDSGPTVQAIAALAAMGIPTFVVGVPGSGPYAGLLNQMASAGGTARPTSPNYYAVNTADQAAFEAALDAVAAKITATCVLELSQAPPDPTHVNVYLDGVAVPQDPVNGWTLEGTTVTLVGTTCEDVLSGTSLDLRIVAGCPTILK